MARGTKTTEPTLRRSARGGGTARRVVKNTPRREWVEILPGGQLRILVLACTSDDTTGIDIASGGIVRIRVNWPDDFEPDLKPFDVVECVIAQDPGRDDLAQPEAIETDGLPRHIGTLGGRRVKKMLQNLAVPPHGPLLGFRGTAAPYFEFRGLRPSVAIIVPTRSPQLLRRNDGQTWVRFGWERDDVWLPVEDPHAARALTAARRLRLSGKDLASALGFRPHYLVASITRPRDGHCYKVVTAVLPRS